jgi:predicted peptidase/chitodextrinase
MSSFKIYATCIAIGCLSIPSFSQLPTLISEGISETGRPAKLYSGTKTFRTWDGKNNGAFYDYTPSPIPTGSYEETNSFTTKFYDGKYFPTSSTNGNAVAISANSTALFCSTCVFSTADIGKNIFIEGAGPNGEDLVTTISSVTNKQNIKISTPAATALTASANARARWYSKGGSISSGSNILICSVANFTAADQNKTIEIIGAGPGGATLITSIQSITNATTVVLTANASNSVTNTKFRYGSRTAYTEGHLVYDNDERFQMNYRLMFPVNYDQNESYRYPMIVMLHGGFEMTGRYYEVGVKTATGVNVTAGADGSLLTCASCRFDQGDVNQNISIGSNSVGIKSVEDATHVTLWSDMVATNQTIKYKYGQDNRYLNNDNQLNHLGLQHMKAVMDPVTGANGKKAEDPTLPSTAFPGFVLYVQNMIDWTDSERSQARSIIDLILKKYNIDPDRIYLDGLSNGGRGVWNFIGNTSADRPELFAAILPMSATVGHNDPVFTTHINKAVPIPSWIFQGGVDKAPYLNETNQVVDALRAAGSNVRYYVYPTVGHGTWGNAFAEPDFFTWMLKQNKRNITVLYGDTTICRTAGGNGVRLALGTGFFSYQWERDGAIISGANLNTYTATQPGTYRARFSRTSDVWNEWSPAVVVRDRTAETPTITALTTSHFPDVKGGNTQVKIQGPTTNYLTKGWYINSLANTTNLLLSEDYNPNTDTYNTNRLDTLNYTLRNTAGVVTLKTSTLDGCLSIASNPIYVTGAGDGTITTPTSLIAPVNPAAAALSANSVKVTWTDGTPNETGIELYRSTAGTDGTFSFYKLLPAGTISYTDTGLQPNQTYYYSIRMVNNTDVSPYTSTINITTIVDTQLPTAPQNLKVGNRTTTSLALNWDASTDNSGIAGYNIYINGSDAPVAMGVVRTSYTLTGLTINSNYTIIVKAIDLAGLESSPSNQAIGSTTFVGLNYSHSAVNVDLLTDEANKWDAPEETGYRANFTISPRKQNDYFNFKFEGYITLPAGSYRFRSSSDDGSAIYMGDEGASAFPFSTTSFSTNRAFNNDGIHGATYGTDTPLSYTFGGTFSTRPITVLFFEKTDGEFLQVEYSKDGGDWTIIPAEILTSGSAPIINPPNPVTNLVASATSMISIDLTWTVPASGSPVDYYEVYRGVGNSPNNFSLVSTSTISPFVDDGLVPNTIYTYKIKCVSNTNGSSVFSTTASDTTNVDTEAPSVPTAINLASINDTNAVIQWAASTDNVQVTGYHIFVNGNQVGISATPTFHVMFLTPSTTYQIEVSAFDARGNESLKSTQVPLKTASVDTEAPGVPTGINLASINDTNAVIQWVASTDNVQVTGYHIFVNGNQVGTSNTHSFHVTSLLPSTTYQIEVSAFDARGNESSKSTPIPLRTKPLEELTTGLEGNGGNELTFSVYPNPLEQGSSFILVGTSDRKGDLEIRILDLIGKDVYSQPLSIDQFSKGVKIEQSLPVGVYIVLIGQERKTIHQKIAVR